MAECIDHTFPPIEIVPLAFPAPMDWRAEENAPQVGDLVGQLDGLCPNGHRRRVLELQPPPLCLGQRHVIGELGNKIRNVGTETLHEFLFGHIRVLDYVMEKRRHDQIGIGFRDSHRNQLSDFDQVVDVRFGGGALSSLIGVLFGGEQCG